MRCSPHGFDLSLSPSLLYSALTSLPISSNTMLREHTITHTQHNAQRARIVIAIVASASSSSSSRGSLPSRRRRHRLRRRVRRSGSLALPIPIVVVALVAAAPELLREAMMCFTRLPHPVLYHAGTRVHATPKEGSHNAADPRKSLPHRAASCRPMLRLL